MKANVIFVLWLSLLLPLRARGDQFSPTLGEAKVGTTTVAAGYIVQEDSKHFAVFSRSDTGWKYDAVLLSDKVAGQVPLGRLSAIKAQIEHRPKAGSEIPERTIVIVEVKPYVK